MRRPRICFMGDHTHLGETLRRAARAHGFEIPNSYDAGELFFSCYDVLDHEGEDMERAHSTFLATVRHAMNKPVVVTSQVPPGTTRRWAKGVTELVPIYYQVDTIIMKQAFTRAMFPEQIVVGCKDPDEPLPLAYQEYLAVHDCPVFQMSYESAELAKCAINYALAKQIEMAHDLNVVAERVSADYSDVARVLHHDARIGSWAYLRPGMLNQHLERDVSTIARIGLR